MMKLKIKSFSKIHSGVCRQWPQRETSELKLMATFFKGLKTKKNMQQTPMWLSKMKQKVGRPSSSQKVFCKRMSPIPSLIAWRQRLFEEVLNKLLNIITPTPTQKRKWRPTPIFLPGKSHGQRSLAGYSPWGCKESDTT